MTDTWKELSELQPVVLKMLKNSLEKNRVAHAYLLEGDPGTGKKKAALHFAKSLLCEGEEPPCGNCRNCRRIDHGNHPDVHVIEPDGASIKKQQIALLQQEFSKAAVEADRKIYIIEHADKMTASAANSLLKFLEEPASDTTALLLTEQYQRMLPTIISRCQLLSFKPLSPSILKDQLIGEGISIPMASLVSNLTNNLEEALRLSREEWFAQSRRIVLKLHEVLQKQSLEAMVKLQEDFNSHFKDKQQVNLALDLLLLLFKDLMMVQTGKEQDLAFPDQLALLKNQALHSSAGRTAEQITAILEAKRRLESNMNPQLLMEQLVLKLQGGPSFV
ncbi:DNA polymerase III subunit delta' [Bacillus thermotolerans]|uniref:DNA polymerase III subunit delta' n=1 Tax=Bacillus thermotolerans TaxID=1221996 RepID=UPI0005836B6B|nr:DNA polymerase III subunit delta' [Bacillus thermotolerans]KKB35311.1 DNA polymerase III delta prime subunit [Bacillus thermotolerans]